MIQPEDRLYYSQNSEDFLLWVLFNDQTAPGYFVEVGALDGVRFSNTYSFEQAGWTGICIEAHPDYIELLRKNRPNSKIVHAAVANFDREYINFYANSRGSLSTLNADLEEEFRGYGEYFTGWEVKQVPMHTLDTILSLHGAPVGIDILSIDVEGGEVAVLQGLDLDKYAPRVIIAEVIHTSIEMEVDAILTTAGYHRARKLSNNVFYCRDRTDARIIAEVKPSTRLVHCLHPIDSGELVVRPSKAEKLVQQLNDLMPQERPFREIFKGFVLKEDTDFVLSGARFPLSQNCLHILARVIEPRSYLEIGTRYGYSLGAVVHGSPKLRRPSRILNWFVQRAQSLIPKNYSILSTLMGTTPIKWLCMIYVSFGRMSVRVAYC